MNVEIIDQAFKLDIYGFQGMAINKDYKATAFKLMDQTWKVVKAFSLKNKGRNVWVYEPKELVFAGLELTETPKQKTDLEQKSLFLLKYGYYKHVGPYHLIKQTGQIMIDELKIKGFETTLPYIEIYGHWTKNEMELETELLMSLK